LWKIFHKVRLFEIANRTTSQLETPLPLKQMAWQQVSRPNPGEIDNHKIDAAAVKPPGVAIWPNADLPLRAQAPDFLAVVFRSLQIHLDIQKIRGRLVT
jgi:hypothetical protein